MNMKNMLRGLLLSALLLPLGSQAQTPTTQITTEYLMTLHIPLDPPQQIDATSFVYNVRPGGWAKGPKIQGALLAPGGDWFRAMPGGNGRLDVRSTLKTDDGALIFLSYNGIMSHSKESYERFMKGETLSSKDFYLAIAPTMQTSSPKYAWLNHVQCVGKVVGVKVGENSFVQYDIYIVR